MPDEAKWYVVHTYSGYENKVASTLMTTVENRGLQDLIQAVKVPTETVVSVEEEQSSTDYVGELSSDEADSPKSKGKKKEPKTTERKLYPGYVFVKMVYTDETWYVVRNIRGCTGFVGPSSKPVPLTESEVYRMGVETRVIELSYNVGDQVRIISGPFEDFVGIVDELDADKNYVRITISMFGRETPIELEINQAEAIEE